MKREDLKDEMVSMVVVGIVLCLALLVGLSFIVTRFTNDDPAIVSVFAGTVLLMFAYTRIFCRKLPKDNEIRLINPDTTIKQTFIMRQSVWLWTGQYRRVMKNALLAPFSLSVQEAAIRVNPITENPKVREITLSARFRFGGDYEKSEALKATKAKLDKENEGDLIRYFLYEFAEQKSRELGAFYNPESTEQQTKFRELIISYMNEKTANLGLEIRYASFSFN